MKSNCKSRLHVKRGCHIWNYNTETIIKNKKTVLKMYANILKILKFKASTSIAKCKFEPKNPQREEGGVGGGGGGGGSRGCC
jgi:hypothetical protein